ncbi:tRNA dihydrouridine(20/20a) synthase DusA [Legionella jamestowniensis]|uniref:tRNA-dihydrouridine(20/20a) synthase n=2 Tax=Legionella jamestowniensis TaxID=455 RepID=A0A0W0UKG5_9GAMM|nr:tRNA dihydrouridine(20/20a) synthase DusA [Legionella jamestowniensis]KTD08255.1 tRNA-dihydrouridine synthase A [Legionella jamestowniensis]SFL97795.1 tRNA-dihydrouridine synthase A [Legionella jamestowniensis DSM 19215]
MSAALISPLSIAPMIDWTYTHFRVFMRLIAPRALLYTDMQTTGAILNNPNRALSFNSIEHPLALQLGGADKDKLVMCAKLAQDAGFDEINLNLGCPSDKVQAGRFGACMMNEPEQVAACISAMKSAVSIPVTAKTRIGVDNQDSYDFFAGFVHQLVNAGCDKLIVHARKAWLSGLNPKQNRTIPPINYEFVYRIKKELPSLPIVINGNINTLQGIDQHMVSVDGVMLGRLACQNPYALAVIHQYYYPEVPIRSRYEILQNYIQYIESAFSQGTALSVLLKPLFNFAHGLAGAKQWKEVLMSIQQNKQIAKLQDAITMFTALEPV